MLPPFTLAMTSSIPMIRALTITPSGYAPPGDDEEEEEEDDKDDKDEEFPEDLPRSYSKIALFRSSNMLTPSVAFCLVKPGLM